LSNRRIANYVRVRKGVRDGEHAPQGFGEGNMPRMVRKGETCFGRLVESGEVRLG